MKAVAAQIARSFGVFGLKPIRLRHASAFAALIAFAAALFSQSAFAQTAQSAQGAQSSKPSASSKPPFEYKHAKVTYTEIKTQVSPVAQSSQPAPVSAPQIIESSTAIPSGDLVLRAGGVQPTNELEAGLSRTLEMLQQNQLREALVEIEKVIKRRPDFMLAHMVKGDLLMARSGKPVAFGFANKALASGNEGVLNEAKVRLARYLDAPPRDYLPTELLSMGSWQKHAILVDLERSRIYIFENKAGQPQLVADYYASIGKNGLDKQREGDQRTPIGVYSVTESRNKLPDFYGPIAYPINYPNEWDKLAGKTGYGIWLHGVPSNTYARPPRATDGCVVLANEDVKSLYRYVQPGFTPVIITSRSDWQPVDIWRNWKSDFVASFNQWKKDWESLRMDAYLSHYSRRFFAEGQNYSVWSERKRKVNADKSFVRLELSNNSMLGFAPLAPVQLAQAGKLTAADAGLVVQNQTSTSPIMVVTYEQVYQSSNLSNKTWKRQYWQRENGVWRIIYEAGV
jgi:murein L,D-transpeptidase YafK